MSVNVSPWASAGLLAAGISAGELQVRVPRGSGFFAQVPHRRHGSKQGPFRFTLTSPDKPTRLEVASRAEDIPAALDRLFAPEDRLQEELAASLAARGIG